MKRYFEFVSDTSAKFWEIATNGNEVAVRFGRIGTEGQTQVKTLVDAGTAIRHAGKLVASKMAKGYCEMAAC